MQRDLVELHDGAVDLVAEGVPAFLQIGAVGIYGVEACHDRRLPVYREARTAQELERAALVRELGGGVALAGRLGPRPLREHVGRDHLVGPQPERPACRDGRVPLAKRAGRGVPRVGKEPEARCLPAGVQLLERRQRQVDLASHLDLRRDLPGRKLEARGHLADGAHVLRDVLADAAVASGGGPDQLAVLVGDRDREAVDLRLADETQRGGVLGRHLEQPLEATPPGEQLVHVDDLVEAHHRHLVGSRCEQCRDRRADLFGRRSGDGELGVLGFQSPQLVDEGVVVGVGDLRLCRVVVPVVVVGDRLPQLGRPSLQAGRRARAGPQAGRRARAGGGLHAAALEAIPEPTTSSPT